MSLKTKTIIFALILCTAIIIYTILRALVLPHVHSVITVIIGGFIGFYSNKLVDKIDDAYRLRLFRKDHTAYVEDQLKNLKYKIKEEG